MWVGVILVVPVRHVNTQITGDLSVVRHHPVKKKARQCASSLSGIGLVALSTRHEMAPPGPHGPRPDPARGASGTSMATQGGCVTLHSDHFSVEGCLPKTQVLLWMSGEPWRAVCENVL
jgi:hypothetical protein